MENRNFLRVQLGGYSYQALLDPGATLSLVGPKIADKFRDRIEPVNLSIKSVTGGITQVIGGLKLILDVDGKTHFGNKGDCIPRSRYDSRDGLLSEMEHRSQIRS